LPTDQLNTKTKEETTDYLVAKKYALDLENCKTIQKLTICTLFNKSLTGLTVSDLETLTSSSSSPSKSLRPMINDLLQS
jgi:hypothetical protein